MASDENKYKRGEWARCRGPGGSAGSMAVAVLSQGDRGLSAFPGCWRGLALALLAYAMLPPTARADGPPSMTHGRTPQATGSDMAEDGGNRTLGLADGNLVELGNVGAVRDDQDGDSFRLASTDHLTLIGGTLIERLQTDGRLEVALYQHFGALQPSGSSLQVRNLGWSGDDVWGTARAVFGQPNDGFARLKSDLALTQPSVALIAYGANESFAGPEGLGAFQAGLRSVIAMTQQTGARPVLVTPPPFEDLGPPLPSMAGANQNLAGYCAAIRQIARELKLPLIDLHQQILDRPALGTPRTENGIHLTAAGRGEVSRLLVDGLLGRETADAQWAAVGQADDLLAMVRQKNEWFFHRHRPQNETYLFLFRKHEQGNNAVEIPQFDALIQGLEQTLQRAMAVKSRD